MLFRFLGTVLGSALLVATAAPIGAQQVVPVVPADGKWAGLRDVSSCDTVDSSDITSTSTPDELDCLLPISGTTEAVDFRIQNRQITSLAFDVVINCHPSDTRHWSATSMRFTSTSGWGYTVVGGGTSTAIPENGLLRMAFPVEESVQYPAGSVRATFDFRGQSPTVAIFYEGTLTEGSFSNRCISNRNTPTIIQVRRRI